VTSSGCLLRELAHSLLLRVECRWYRPVVRRVYLRETEWLPKKMPNQSTLPPNSRTEARRRVLKSSGNAKLGGSGKGRVSTQRSSQERLPV
jgi:hypothetical protein